MSQAETALSQPTVRVRSQRRRMWQTFISNRITIVGLILIVLIIFTAIFANVLAPYDPYKQDTRNRLAPPSREHPMGLDDYGRDILSRIIYGARVSLVVSVVSVGLAFILGTLLGCFSGYYKGFRDSLIMRFMDIILAFPYILLAIVVVAYLGPSLQNAMIAIAITYIPRFARIVRGSVLEECEKDYVSAARAIGASDFRILFIAILPNCLGPLIVQTTLGFASAILDMAALSFLGLGAQPPTPEWGAMIAHSRALILRASWVMTFPGLAILFAVLGFNLLGDGLRDALDPRLRD